jgi:hypothetical protein
MISGVAFFGAREVLLMRERPRGGPERLMISRPKGRTLQGEALMASICLFSCTSLDLIQRYMSDYVIHSTASMIGEVDSMLSRT